MNPPKNPARNSGKKPEPAKSKGPKPLNIRQERFCEFVVSGMSATEAYIKAGYEVTVKVAGSAGPRMLENVGVKNRIAELRAPQTTKAVMTKDATLKFLTDLIGTPVGEIGPESLFCSEYSKDIISGGARGKLRRGQAASGNEIAGEDVTRVRVKASDKLRAIELLAKLAGYFAPDQLVVETGPKTLEALEERAKNVVSALDRRMRKSTS